MLRSTLKATISQPQMSVKLGLLRSNVNPKACKPRHCLVFWRLCSRQSGFLTGWNHIETAPCWLQTHLYGRPSIPSIWHEVCFSRLAGERERFRDWEKPRLPFCLDCSMLALYAES